AVGRLRPRHRLRRHRDREEKETRKLVCRVARAFGCQGAARRMKEQPAVWLLFHSPRCSLLRRSRISKNNGASKSVHAQARSKRAKSRTLQPKHQPLACSLAPNCPGDSAKFVAVCDVNTITKNQLSRRLETWSILP